MIKLIWAMTRQRVIGKNNRIPWHIKEDLLYYKEQTKGKTVLMGESTYDSLKSYYKDKPLPYGKIYVASLNPALVLSDANVVLDVVDFLKKIEEEIWVVGGATIYRLALPYADALYISWIKESYEGDTYFPELDLSKYRLTWERHTDLVDYTKYEKS